MSKGALLCRAEGRKQGSAVVLYSLVARERKIFEVLAQHQLGAGDEGKGLIWQPLCSDKSRCSILIVEQIWQRTK